MKPACNANVFNLVPEFVLGHAKVAFSTVALATLPLSEAIERMFAQGVRNLEVWADIKHLDPRNTVENTASSVRLIFEKGMRVVSVHAPFTMCSSDSLEKQLFDWEMLACQTIARADCLGASIVVLHPMTDMLEEGNSSFTRIVRHTKNALFRLADIAAVLEIKLALENMPSPGRNRFGRSAGELRALVEESGRQNLGLCLDTGHAVVNGDDVINEIDAAGDYLFSIHLHDNLYGQPGDLHLPPGRGDINWAEVRDKLAAIGYSGNIVLEVEGGNDSLGALLESIVFVRECLAQAGSGADTISSGSH